MSSFHNGKVEYCAISGPGDIKENASVIFLLLRIIPTKFQLNPFIGFEGVVSSRFEFNQRCRLGAVTQKLSI